MKLNSNLFTSNLYHDWINTATIMNTHKKFPYFAVFFTKLRWKTHSCHVLLLLFPQGFLPLINFINISFNFYSKESSPVFKPSNTKLINVADCSSKLCQITLLLLSYGYNSSFYTFFYT